jgi:hypothetical protein
VPFDFFKLNSLLLFKSLVASKDLIVALDASFIHNKLQDTGFIQALQAPENYQ